MDEKKSNLEVLRAAGVQCTLINTTRQWQLNFLGHVMRRQGPENLVVTGKVVGRKATGLQITLRENLPISRVLVLCNLRLSLPNVHLD